jgi:hypothetical protein
MLEFSERISNGQIAERVTQLLSNILSKSVIPKIKCCRRCLQWFDKEMWMFFIISDFKKRASTDNIFHPSTTILFTLENLICEWKLELVVSSFLYFCHSLKNEQKII